MISLSQRIYKSIMGFCDSYGKPEISVARQLEMMLGVSYQAISGRGVCGYPTAEDGQVSGIVLLITGSKL